MEPNNFEKDFREKLNQREIEPSNKAWDRLDAMLSVAEEKKPKKSKKWLYIAASVVGFLLVGTIYLNRFKTEEVKKDQPIVLEQTIDGDTLNNSVINKEDAVNVRSYNSKIIMKGHSIAADSKAQEKQPKQLRNNVALSIQNNVKDTAVNSSESKNNQSAAKNKYISAEKLLAEVSNDKLEAKETKEIVKEPRKSVAVNPNDLLLNAETELNQSFRESALDRLNKKIKVVKTAIANRNYEE